MTTIPTKAFSDRDLEYYKTLEKKYCPSVFDEIKHYSHKDIPEPPKELIDFRNLSPFEKKRDSEKFYKQSFIQEYLDSKWNAELYNRECFLRLYDLYKTERPREELFAIISKLNQFKAAILQNNDVFIALKINFSDYKINSKLPEEQMSLNDDEWT